MFSAEHRRLLGSTAVAAGLNAACWWAARRAELELTVDARDAAAPTAVPLGAVLVATAAGGLAAAVLVLLARRTSRPRRSFALAVGAGLALSCVPPLQATTSTGAALVLILMHLVAAAVIVPSAGRLLAAAPVEAVQP